MKKETNDSSSQKEEKSDIQQHQEATITDTSSVEKTKKPSFFSKIYRTIENVNLTKIDLKVTAILSIFFKITLTILTFFFLMVLYREFHKESFNVSAFQVPESFINDGWNGGVMANTMLDKVENIKLWAFTQKQTEAYTSSSSQQSIEVEVMGIGISVNAVAQYLRTLLGLPIKNITGELLIEGNYMRLRLRVSGEPTQVFSRKITAENRKYKLLHELLELAAQQMIKSTDPVMLSSYYLWVKQDFNRCIEIANYAIEHKPKDAKWAYEIWGKALEFQRNTEGAIDKYKASLKIDSKNIYVWNSWAAALRTEGKYDEAIEKLKKAQEIEPENNSILEEWAAVFRAKGDYKAAEIKYQEALNLNAKNIDILNSWASLLSSQSDYKGAIKKYEQASKIAPNNVQIYDNWASALISENDFETAIEKYKKALEIEPRNIRIYDSWASALKTDGKNKEVVEKYRQALEIEPENPWLLENLANALMTVEDIDAAIVTHQKISEIIPDNIGNLSSWAIALERQMKYDEAIAIHRKVIEMARFDYDRAEAFHHLARANAYLDNFEMVLKYSELAMKYGNTMWDYVDEIPFSKYANKKELKDIIAKYHKEEDDGLLDDLLMDL